MNQPNGPEAARIVMALIKARLTDLPAWQQARDYHATLDEWTVERRLVTPTLKLRRERVIEEFSNEIRAMYDRD